MRDSTPNTNTIPHDFKLLAIRPLKGCDEKYLKNLVADEYYYFYDGYKFSNDLIVSIPANQFDLYSDNEIVINISAIVGDNGSGKSSLVELLYLALFNLAVKNQILPYVNEDDGKSIKFVNRVGVDIYVQGQGEIRKLRVLNSQVTLTTLSSGEVTNINPENKKVVESLFYCLVINYSHYALNSLHLGNWVKDLFHKNDGYQTPVVLNPFRNEGNIDINKEEYLTKSRLLSNLIVFRQFDAEKRKGIRTLVPGKTVTQIKLKYDRKKIAKTKAKTKNSLKMLFEHKAEIENLLREYLITGIALNNPMPNGDYEILFNYLVVKLHSISTKYSPYKEEYNFFKNEIFDKSKFVGLLKKIKSSPSHVAFKIRQAVNYARHFEFILENRNKWIPIESLNEQMQHSATSKSRVIDFVPPSFFEFDLKFEGRGTFNQLSSGEKQRIYANANYKYHLYNLDSVDVGSYLKYKCILLVFDEIELYFHPEFQRTFVQDFIEGINNMHLEFVTSIHCIMITHSPFILSDIPTANILFLNKEVTTLQAIPIRPIGESLGANIHDLLAHDFFMREGFMGEFAKRKISDLILYLNNNNPNTSPQERLSPKWNWNKYNAQMFINLLGEPLLRDNLNDYYNEVLPNLN